MIGRRQETLVDSYWGVGAKRHYQMLKVSGNKPWILRVYCKATHGMMLLTEGEYFDEDVALSYFEARRPVLKDLTEAEHNEIPMQRGKRIVQELMQEKLGGKG